MLRTVDQELVRRFDIHAAAAPDAVALVDERRAVTYRELEHLSSILARRLIDAGVVPGDVVGLSGDRSIEWVVAMLAILRAAGMYLPLPPDLPRERRRLLLREAGVRHVVRDPTVENDLGDAAVVIDVQMAPIAVAGAAPVVPRPGGQADRACVLFTSGTTGTPKGVVVRQSSIVRLVVDTNYVEFTPADAMAFASNTAFDAATFEVWGALLNGSRLVVIPTATLLSPSAFETAMRTNGVTILFLTTELFNRIARARPTAFRGLTWLLFGGEKANVECVRAVLATGVPPANLLHMYGPTECTTFATCHRVTSVPADAGTIPIGAPISGCTIHLLDDRLHPVADGDEGELCIAGAGVAEGYLHRPQETAAVFTTLPIDGTATRLYRTGDRALRRRDGLIEYVGRLDGQIKLRGFRIETAEVEATLTRHPAVRDAVVLVYRGPGGAPRLGACLLMAGSTTAGDVTAVRDFVAERLPVPMVPARLLGYEAFPLTASKKVDRQRLVADLQEDGQDGTGDHADGVVTPADEVEERLAAIWRLILARAPRVADENFFEAGGDSLQAVDMQLRIENEWNIALSASALVEAPTFRRLADHIRRREAPDVRPVVWLTHGPQRPALACVPGAFGHVFFYRSLVALWPDAWGLCALPSRHLDPAGDRRLPTLEEIAAENLARLDAAGAGPVEAIAGYSFGGLVAYEMARLMASRGERPGLVLYDTAAEGEELRGTLLSQRRMPRWRRACHVVRFRAMRMLYRRALGRRWAVPAAGFYPALANMVAVERYRPRPYPGDMLLIRSTITGVPPGVEPETLGWGGLVQGRLTVKSVAAEHGDFFKPPHVSEVAAITTDYLRLRDARWR